MCYDGCQWMGQLGQADEMPLCLQVMLEHFEKWSTDFVGPIAPTSLNQIHILVFTYFVKKWVEDKVVPYAIEKVVVDFLFTDFLLDFVYHEKLLLTMDHSLFLIW